MLSASSLLLQREINLRIDGLAEHTKIVNDLTAWIEVVRDRVSRRGRCSLRGTAQLTPTVCLFAEGSTSEGRHRPYVRLDLMDRSWSTIRRTECVDTFGGTAYNFLRRYIGRVIPKKLTDALGSDGMSLKLTDIKAERIIVDEGRLPSSESPRESLTRN